MRVLIACGLLCIAGCGEPRRQAHPPIDLAAQLKPSTWTERVAGPSGPRLEDPRTGIVFVRIPAGSFEMGGVSAIDTPRHPVEITRPFLLGEAEVTVAQWRRFLLRDGGPTDAPLPEGDDAVAVSGVSWNDAMAFCTAYGYALPSEAQWEYACRANEAPAACHWRDRATLEAHAWIYTNAREFAPPMPGHTKLANAFGVENMLGNVWEWCMDPYLPSYPPSDPGTPLRDPVNTTDTGFRVLRGGSWYSVPAPVPSDRTFADPHNRSFLFGFRVARPVD